MTLHPIAVVDRVLEEYRSYLKTEFRARDEGLREALERALDEPGFLAQEPFFQAHRPFEPGERWRELGLDERMARVLMETSGSERSYLHQSDAIRHLLDPGASPLVVTTGTGSGKTECFLLPVLENAIADSTRFEKSGLTALLVYPMNALANDQEERIRALLEASGHTHVRVARYDRRTPQDEREKLRRSPPHVLLTNYMMLEYLLVRPADREGLFANHRCRYLVLDEVHTYRGALGANIALLFRRLAAHLARARQDWRAEDRTEPERFPSLVPVATSATIKSVDEHGLADEERRRLRDEAVQDFFGRITGREPRSIRILGETLSALTVPAEARWPHAPVDDEPPDPRDPEDVAACLRRLAGMSNGASLETAARQAAILWKLHELLARKPVSLSGIVATIRSEVPERRDAPIEVLRREVEAALVAGAALPDGTPGALRLRTHRFQRGGWRFFRCVDPACGRLYPMGEERCSCGMATAPLYLCRSCGADVLRFRSDGEPPELELAPNDTRSSEDEWVLYARPNVIDGDGDDEPLVGTERQMRHRDVLTGSFDPATCTFSTDEHVLPVPATLAPARTRCLVCGGTAGARDVLTPVALGTSAAVRVLAEGLVEGLAQENRGRPGHDGKERLLIFSDSRQDAAHQARFITYAARYDRMRWRLLRILRESGTALDPDRIVHALVVRGVAEHDNPHTRGYTDVDYLNESVKSRARAWEEAPLLDDLAIGASYRGTVFNLGLVGVRYQHLERYAEDRGEGLAGALGVDRGALLHICRCLLDEMRRRGAVGRPMLRYHPGGTSCPDEFKGPADWERKIKAPTGYPCENGGEPIGTLDRAKVPDGITCTNAWRRQGQGGRSPSLEVRFRHLLRRFGGGDATEDLLLDVLRFLCQGPRMLVTDELHGFRSARRLLQVNAGVVALELLSDGDRFRCSICNVRMPWVAAGSPCPACHGELVPWPEEAVYSSRYVARLLGDPIPLHAGEHTAQITSEDRSRLEEDFKASPSVSPVNVLACSPTLEMGIDVGGLDAVVLRNVPPRPDNYAQRGGRSGRRSRVGIVLAYARSTPHDGYFYDKPEEMIAGEVPAPGIGLGNRDVTLRHLHAIVFGAAEPGLAGRMAEYVNLQGDLQRENVDGLIEALAARYEHAAELALAAWGPEILGPAGLDSRERILEALLELPGRIEDLFARVRRQIVQLEETIQRWTALGRGDRAAVGAMDLKRRLLGLPREGREERSEADDRTSGNPMRRFAEFGILPGYEFPSEPSSVRLLGDAHEEEVVTVERRFGIAQYQPEAKAHARGHRWRVVGLDLASPWNPKSPEPGWIYSRCRSCDLRYGSQEHVRCPRCRSEETLGEALPGHEFGGFLAVREDSPVLEEEDRFALASLVRCQPQWNGRVVARYDLPTGWTAELRHEEEIRWVNESRPASAQEIRDRRPRLFDDAKGFPLCPHCGRLLSFAPPDGSTRRGRRRARRGDVPDPYEHGPGCAQRGQPPRPLAITARNSATTLRVIVVLPAEMEEDDYRTWGYSLGFCLRSGLRHLYLLDGPEIEFELEPSWSMERDGRRWRFGALLFVDPAVGGSGFLDRAVEELHLVAARALEHLEHEGCESACYRCLKSYQNQRVHAFLSWPAATVDLEQLAGTAPVPCALERGDLDDPRPWLEAYDAGVGSPLELRFLRVLEGGGLSLRKQVPVSPESGGEPISVADFVVEGTRIAIYVDGAAFHRGSRLRRDRKIRESLRRGPEPWSVIEFNARDLGDPNAVVQRVMRSR